MIAIFVFMKTPKAENVDAYINDFPDAVRARLTEMRSIIRAAAPEAEETISYGMPTFKLNGNLVHFAAHTSHVGFYPMPEGVDAFDAEAAPYRSGKGTLQFPIDKPLPESLITRIVNFRVSENLKKKKKR